MKKAKIGVIILLVTIMSLFGTVGAQPSILGAEAGMPADLADRGVYAQLFATNADEVSGDMVTIPDIAPIITSAASGSRATFKIALPEGLNLNVLGYCLGIRYGNVMLHLRGEDAVMTSLPGAEIAAGERVIIIIGNALSKEISGELAFITFNVLSSGVTSLSVEGTMEVVNEETGETQTVPVSSSTTLEIKPHTSGSSGGGGGGGGTRKENIARIIGDVVAVSGEETVQSVEINTNSDASSIYVMLKYPEYMDIKEIALRDFAEVTMGEETIVNGSKYIKLEGVYDHEGNCAPKRTEIIPFDIVFTVADDATGECGVELVDGAVIGDNWHPFDSITNATINILSTGGLEDYDVMSAFYFENRLVDAKIRDKNNGKIEVTTDTGFTDVKVMLWESLQSTKPICYANINR